jgi:hypothetical protein
MVLGHPSKNSQTMETFTPELFFENGLGSFQTFLILQISDKPEVLKRFYKQFLKLNSKSKKPCIF